MAMQKKDLVDNIGRRTWDLEKYKTGEDDDEDSIYNQTGPTKEKGAVIVREALQQRNYTVDLTSNVGKFEVVMAGAATSARGGFYCDACECLLKDSKTYLDHINGKKHQRKLGMSMRVEKSTLADVKKKLSSLKRKDAEIGEKVGVEERLALAEQSRRQRKKARKQMQEEEQEQREDEDEDDVGAAVVGGVTVEGEGEETEEDAMAKMMGFGGFAASKHKH
jgi:U4/U6.U5 tri-snRNP component SNU23